MEISNNSEYFFGKNVRFLRKSLKMTLISLSEAIKISKSALSDYETNKFLPGLEVMQKLSNFFNVPIDDLYNSDISELYKNGKPLKGKNRDETSENENFLALENEKYIFNIKLLTQRLESTQLQMQLLRQLLESREAENKTLKINIRLLEEQLKNFS